MAALTQAGTGPVNLSSLGTTTTLIGAASSIAIAVANIFGGGVQPQFTQGYQPNFPLPVQGYVPFGPNQLPPALLFHYEGEQSVFVEADITDHFIEDNTAIQDQIALKPEIISTHGFIGELNDVAPGVLAALQTATNALTTISGYLPGLSATALLAYNEAFQLYQTANAATNSAVSAYNSLAGGATPGGGEAVVGNGQITNAQGLTSPNPLLNTNTQSKQQIMFQQLYGYMQGRVLFTVQTPWAVFLNCAIKSLRPIQDAETRMITDFQVEFKVIKTAATAAVQQAVARAANQSAAPVSNGTGNTIPAGQSSNQAISSDYPNTATSTNVSPQ